MSGWWVFTKELGPMNEEDAQPKGFIGNREPYLRYTMEVCIQPTLYFWENMVEEGILRCLDEIHRGDLSQETLIFSPSAKKLSKSCSL